MSYLYVVRPRGVYWKGIHYISTSMDKAVSECKKFARNDVDSYHEWVVSRIKSDTVLEEFDPYGKLKWSQVYITTKDEEGYYENI